MGQPTYLKENFDTNLIKSSIKIGPGGSYPHHFSYGNLLPGSISPFSGLILSCNPTSGPTLGLAPVLALVSAPALAPIATNKLFKQFMKTYLKINQGPRQPLA